MKTENPSGEKTIRLFAGILLTSFIMSFTLYSQPTRINYYPDSAQHQISKHIYGHFAEHLGRCIYGGFWVKENSANPNQDRYRTDVIEAFREIAIPNLRWPGGCFADTYHWRDGIGPRSERPTMINTHWGGVTEDNSFGSHEFLELCRLLDCEPVICGNVGSGTVREMSQWVEYLNSDNISPVTDLRRQNGQDEPFKVKYWGIGNENWGCGGNMSSEFYADQLRRFSTYCNNYGDNRLYKVACGPYGDLYEWTETLMKNPKTRSAFHGLSLHHYTITHDWSHKGSAIDFDESEWFSSLSKTLVMDEYIRKHVAIMDKYDPEGEKGLIVDEWGIWHDVEPGTNPGFLYQQNTLRDALIAAINLDIFNNHCRRVKMANIAQAVNVLQSMVLTKEDQMVRTPSFYVFKMYKIHHDARLIPHQANSAKYTFQDHSVEAIHTSCSVNEEGIIHVTLTNLDPSNTQPVEAVFNHTGKISVINGELITSEKMNAYNDFGKEEEVNITEFKDFKSKGNTININMPSKSVVCLKLKAEN